MTIRKTGKRKKEVKEIKQKASQLNLIYFSFFLQILQIVYKKIKLNNMYLLSHFMKYYNGIIYVNIFTFYSINMLISLHCKLNTRKKIKNQNKL